MLRHFTKRAAGPARRQRQCRPVRERPRLTILPVVSGLAQPTALAFLADGDFLILEKSAGTVRA
jgi:glucose/arabinose dehydrogenase